MDINHKGTKGSVVRKHEATKKIVIFLFSFVPLGSHRFFLLVFLPGDLAAKLQSLGYVQERDVAK